MMLLATPTAFKISGVHNALGLMHGWVYLANALPIEFIKDIDGLHTRIEQQAGH